MLLMGMRQMTNHPFIAIFAINIVPFILLFTTYLLIDEVMRFYQWLTKFNLSAWYGMYYGIATNTAFTGAGAFLYAIQTSCFADFMSAMTLAVTAILLYRKGIALELKEKKNG